MPADSSLDNGVARPWVGRLAQCGLLLTTIMFCLLAILNLNTIHVISKRDIFAAIPTEAFTPHVYYWHISTILISFLGVFGSVFSKVRVLNTFAILATINALATMRLTMSGENLINNSTINYMDQLNRSMQSYDWLNNATDATIWNATMEWDSIQMTGCCGMSSPVDWNVFRPKEVKSFLYPRTCCPHSARTTDRKQLCYMSTGKLFWSGCIDKILETESMLEKAARLDVIVQYILAILAIVVGIDILKYKNRQVTGGEVFIDRTTNMIIIQTGSTRRYYNLSGTRDQRYEALDPPPPKYEEACCSD